MKKSELDLRGHESGQVKTFCPNCHQTRKHQNEPSLQVNLDTGGYRCWNCDIVGYLEDVAPGPYASKVKREYKAPPEPAKVERPDPEVLEYFSNRGISERTLAEFRISYGPSFPVYDFEGPKRADGKTPLKRDTDGNPVILRGIQFPCLEDGKVVNMKYLRPREWDEDGERQFRSFPGGKPVPFGLDRADGMVVICEGEIDAMSVFEAGIPQVWSVPLGSKAFDWLELESVVERLHRLDYIYIAVDNDADGRACREELIRRLTQLCGPEKLSVVYWPDGCKDANDVLRAYGPARLKEVVEDESKSIPLDGVSEIHEFVPEYLEFYDDGLPKGFSTGIPTLDPLYRVMPGMFSVITGVTNYGKALAVDTPILTPFGWTTMGDLHPGDYVLGPSGQPTMVIAATSYQLGRPVYDVRFSDGGVIKADANHKWEVIDYKGHPQVLTTEDLARPRPRPYKVRLSAPVELGGSGDLWIPAYTLGVWLGDGSSSSATITSADEEVIEHVRDDGYEVLRSSGKYAWRVSGLYRQLRERGLLRRKRIPREYLFAPIGTRTALLRGLMDTDGFCSKAGTAVFYNKSLQLVGDLLELAHGLGFKTKVYEKRSILNGRDFGVCYVVTLYGSEILPFSLERKAVRWSAARRTPYRTITAITPVESVPVKCIQVTDPSHMFLAGRNLVPTRNSELMDEIVRCMNLEHGWKFAFYTPENYPMSLHMIKLAEKFVGKPFDTTRPGHMSREEALKAADWMQQTLFYINPRGITYTIEEILEKAKALVYRKGIQGLVIDPWNYVRKEFNGLREDQYINECMQLIGVFTKATGCHVWLTVHPRTLRKDKDGKIEVPTVMELSGGSKFGDNADFMFAVHRDPGKAFETGIHEVTVHVQKSRYRYAAIQGNVTLEWSPFNGRFTACGQASIGPGAVDTGAVEYTFMPGEDGPFREVAA